MRKKPLGRLAACTLCGLTLLPLQAHSQQADETEQLLIQVTEGQRAAVGSNSMASEPIQRLTSNPAVSLSRMGGRGLDGHTWPKPGAGGCAAGRYSCGRRLPKPNGPANQSPQLGAGAELTSAYP